MSTNRINYGLGIFLIFMGFSVYASQEPQAISFSQAIQLALSRNPKITASQNNVKASFESVNQANSMKFPRLNVEINASRSDNPLSVLGYKLSQQSASFSEPINSPGYYNNIDTGIALSMPIFSGGRIPAYESMAQSSFIATKYKDKDLQSSLVYNLFQIYEGINVTKQLIKIQLQSLQDASQYIKTTKSLYNQSVAIQSDVLLAKTYKQNIKLQLNLSNLALQNQINQFNNLLGFTNNRFIPGRQIKLFTPSNNPNILKNPHILMLKSHLNATRAGIDIAKSENMPQANLQIRHDWNAKSIELKHPSNSAMLQMNWTLLSAGEQTANINKAVDLYNSDKDELQAETNEAQLQISQNYRNAKLYKTQLDANKEMANEMKKALSMLIDRYGRGDAIFSQILEAQSRLDAYNAQIVMSNYQYELAKAQILILEGQLIQNNYKNNFTRIYL